MRIQAALEASVDRVMVGRMDPRDPLGALLLLKPRLAGTGRPLAFRDDQAARVGRPIAVDDEAGDIRP